MPGEAAALAPTDRRTMKVVGLVSLGHFFSHLFYMLIPPLFPVLKEALAADYTSLGLVITAYSAVSAAAQVPIGFLVDRYDAAVVLVIGLAAASIAIIAIGLYPSYTVLFAFMLLLGLGDSVFHPADYSILSQTVRPDMLGRAFSVHGFAGHLGFAAGPLIVITLASIWDWRAALITSGSAGLLVAMLLFKCRDKLRSRPNSSSERREDSAQAATGGFSVLLSAPLLLGLLFFAGLALTGTGVRDFGIATLHVLYDAPLTQAGTVVSAFLFASPIGVLMGGWIADHTVHHDRIAMAALMVVATVAFLVAGLTPSLFIVATLFGFAGLGIGAMAPSRDMLIVKLTPEGHIGKAFGFVSVGLGVGGIIGPVTFGYLLDHSAPNSVFWLAGGFALLTVICLIPIGRLIRRGATQHQPMAKDLK